MRCNQINLLDELQYFSYTQPCAAAQFASSDRPRVESISTFPIIAVRLYLLFHLTDATLPIPSTLTANQPTSTLVDWCHFSACPTPKSADDKVCFALENGTNKQNFTGDSANRIQGAINCSAGDIILRQAGR